METRVGRQEPEARSQEQIPFSWEPARYQLIAKKGARSGALLRFTFEDGLIGYADCHPWSELDDLPLDQQLDLLRQGKLTPLTSQSYRFGRLDAEARAAGINLLEGLAIPPSHYLVMDLNELTVDDLRTIQAKGFSHLKVKVGREITNDVLPLSRLMEESDLNLETTVQDDKVMQDCELESLLMRGNHSQKVKAPPIRSDYGSKNCVNLSSSPAVSRLKLKWRLDFNGRLSPAECITLLEKMKPFLELIDFIEDPFPYDAAAWSAIQTQYGISLACDRGALRAIGSPHAARVVILKPAIHSEEPFLLSRSHGQRIVVTSYLDHPIGQASAAYIAAKLDVRDVCGLVSHRVYEPTPFSAHLSIDSPAFHPIPGTGFGFDSLLLKQYLHRDTENNKKTGRAG
jgi:o-succinylbenzoate synthase